MNNLLSLAILITLLFCFTKFVEMKYLDKEFKPLKIVVRDALIVFICSMVASYLIFNMSGSINDFLNIVTENKTMNMESAKIFTDTPGF